MTASILAGPQTDVSSILEDIRNGSWFAAVGDPLLDGERIDAVQYLQGLGLGNYSIQSTADWQSASKIIQNPNWNPDWWHAEEKEKTRLFDRASKRIGDTACMLVLSDVLAASTSLHGLSAVAAARGGASDPGLIRAAAGAGSQSAHYAALAHLAGEKQGHAFAAKFRLFIAGRWPLCAVGNDFYLF